MKVNRLTAWAELGFNTGFTEVCSPSKNLLECLQKID